MERVGKQNLPQKMLPGIICSAHTALKLSAVAISSVRAASKDAAVLTVLVYLVFTKVSATACSARRLQTVARLGTVHRSTS